MDYSRFDARESKMVKMRIDRNKKVGNYHIPYLSLLTLRRDNKYF